MNIMSGYTISDEDVNGVVRYMQHLHPEKADPVYCRAMLEDYHSGVIKGLHDVALDNPDAIEALFDQYEEYLKNSRQDVPKSDI